MVDWTVSLMVDNLDVVLVVWKVARLAPCLAETMELMSVEWKVAPKGHN
jgi:hypothetical protein